VEIYTISGSPDVQLLGGPMPSCPNATALKVAGGVTRLGSLGLGGYGIYRGFHKGWGPAALSLLGAAALWFSGSRLHKAAGLAEEACGK
jgi:hypothetical protein